MIDFSKDMDPDVAALCLPLTDDSKRVRQSRDIHETRVNYDFLDRDAAAEKSELNDSTASITAQSAATDKRYNKAMSFGDYDNRSSGDDFTKG